MAARKASLSNAVRSVVAIRPVHPDKILYIVPNGGGRAQLSCKTAGDNRPGHVCDATLHQEVENCLEPTVLRMLGWLPGPPGQWRKNSPGLFLGNNLSPHSGCQGSGATSMVRAQGGVSGSAECPQTDRSGGEIGDVC
jgi:hypothetical protein